MDFEYFINAVSGNCCDADTVADQKNTWSSLPMEIKKKIVKYLSMKARNRVKRVCKQWLDVVKDLNNLETKLVLLDETDGCELPEGANSLCNLARHRFDRTSMIRLPTDLVDSFALKTFPNLVAVYLSKRRSNNAALYIRECPKVEHLSLMGEHFLQEDASGIEQLDLVCLHEHVKPYPPLNAPKILHLKLAHLKYYRGFIADIEVVRDLLQRGLVGFSMNNWTTFAFMTQYALDTEILYDVDTVDALSQMHKLTTIYMKDDVERLDELELTNVTKVSWKAANEDYDWTIDELYEALKLCGHRLRSFRLGSNLQQELVIKAVLETCPNLEEFHVHRMDPDYMPSDEVQGGHLMSRNSVREFEMLKQFTKLKTLSVEHREVDLKFLRMFDPEMPELQAIGKQSMQMSIQQLVRFQFEISERKSMAAVLESKNLEIEAKDNRIRELESQLAKAKTSNS